MAKVILIDSRGWQGARSGQNAFPNIGIAYLTPALQKAGHQVLVIDLNNEDLTDNQVFAIIDNHKPDIVGFSVKTATMASSRDLAQKIKQRHPSVFLLAGGPHVSLMWRELIAEKLFDVIFVGEGEEILPVICQRLIKKQAIDNLSGVVTQYNLSENVFINPPLIQNLDKLCFPKYDLFPSKVKEFIRTNYPLSTSRGCVYNCIYCSVPKISGKKFRARSPENVIQELKQAESKYNICGFEIIDDLFNLDIERCKAICRLLIKNNLRLPWSCPNGLRADRVDEELANLMWQSGCRSVNVGIESADPEIFAQIKKGETLAQVERGVKIFQKAGIDVTGYFIIGLPGDSLAVEKKSVKFIKKLGINAFFNMLVPYPGTEVWNWVNEHARFLGNPEEALHFADEVGKINVMFETANFTAKERLYAYEMVHAKLGHIGLIVPRKISRFKFFGRALALLWKYNRFDVMEYVVPFKRFLSKTKNKKV